MSALAPLLGQALAVIAGWAMLGVASGAFAADTCTARSATHRVALVELYTSEGCDSCPPADRWLTDLAKQGFDPRKAVGLALHVDYWDHLGWKDPYARSAFAARQRELVRLSGARVSYTPQVVLNGRDFRRWYDAGEFAKAVRAINDTPAGVQIELEFKRGGQETAEVAVQVTSSDAAVDRDAALYVALYEDGLSTSVLAGENKGRTLRHDRVVREWFGPIVLSGARTELRRAVMLPVRSKVTGAVAFVQHRRTGEVLQSVGLAGCA